MTHPSYRALPPPFTPAGGSLIHLALANSIYVLVATVKSRLNYVDKEADLHVFCASLLIIGYPIRATTSAATWARIPAGTRYSYTTRDILKKIFTLKNKGTLE